MKTSTYILAKFLNCDAFQCDALNTIVMDVDELFEKAPEKTLTGFAKAVENAAQEYLTDIYIFAAQKLRENPNLYDGSVLNWDANLLKDAINYLDPEKDLHAVVGKHEIYLELDNWDLYSSVIDTINEDYNSGLSFKVLAQDFCSDFCGGNKTPDKYESLLL